MSLKKRLVKTPPGTEYVEATMIPRTVDINDYYMKRSNADMYSGLKPSLKPLKWSNAIKKNSQRELDVEALEAGHKRIIYIRTFNHVKNEAIVTQPDITPVKNAFSATQGFEKKKRGPNGKKATSLSLETQLTISCFKKNKKKFDPAKQIKKKQESETLRFDENSAPKDFAFLTGVNIQETEKVKEEKEDGENEEDEEDYDIIDLNEKQNVLREIPANMNRLYESKSREGDRPQSMREQNNLPVIRKPWTANPEKPSISASETRYKNYMSQKPKMYISAKMNSVQAFGRPSNYKEHLTRVFNKEDTPVIPYGLVDHLGPRKDYRKALLDSYLSQFNLEALKYIDEDLYEYAKQKASL